MDKVLIIEDEKELADICGTYLEVEGMQAVIAYDGEEGIKLFSTEHPDLVLLDIMLPKKNGIDLCKEIREQSQVPIIMVSAKSADIDKVVALGVGADDYVTKPYSPIELVARVKANLRRYHTSVPKNEDGGCIQIGKLKLYRAYYTAYIEEDELCLTTKEFEILSFFATNPSVVLSREQIYQHVWGYEGVCDDNSVTVYIRRLREKMEKKGVDYIKTIWGAGYKFAVS